MCHIAVLVSTYDHHTSGVKAFAQLVGSLSRHLGDGNRHRRFCRQSRCRLEEGNEPHGIGLIVVDIGLFPIDLLALAYLFDIKTVTLLRERTANNNISIGGQIFNIGKAKCIDHVVFSCIIVTCQRQYHTGFCNRCRYCLVGIVIVSENKVSSQITIRKCCGKFSFCLASIREHQTASFNCCYRAIYRRKHRKLIVGEYYLSHFMDSRINGELGNHHHVPVAVTRNGNSLTCLEVSFVCPIFHLRGIVCQIPGRCFNTIIKINLQFIGNGVAMSSVGGQYIDVAVLLCGKGDLRLHLILDIAFTDECLGHFIEGIGLIRPDLAAHFHGCDLSVSSEGQ